MTWNWSSLIAVGALTGATPLVAQQVRDLGVEVLVTTADPALLSGGLWAAVHASRRLRLAATVSAGISDGEAAGRGELLGHFLLSPGETTRPGFYLGGGVAGVVGRVDQGYAVALIGIEQGPRRGSGWALEFGVGGGIRVTAGWRWWRWPR